jgi:hypothetical protein
LGSRGLGVVLSAQTNARTFGEAISHVVWAETPQAGIYTPFLSQNTVGEIPTVWTFHLIRVQNTYKGELAKSI